MDNNQLSHDILNLIERLRIMHDLAKSKNYSSISKAEMSSDLDETMEDLKKNLKQLIDVD